MFIITVSFFREDKKIILLCITIKINNDMRLKLTKRD